ncbi:protein of unknown function [Taphrina deformans PYCC 5710]|uniref:Vacuolar protein sorting-associated protein 13 n=1 Tax=Taphrina deformans (strain PYCC 5710 / ATCC 11124 / CBS 356.35 / IMI 108563 / JCM 9778 / NBRC 8474) TaxID=1097556 RepID=R4XNS4_TAPDE|nr:protein of unknown function [Taphrina deformans PYCC 5710]|eukprot:CCG84914.1 protein of unknown function [Taphrina deformans PYCC 5710]
MYIDTSIRAFANVYNFSVSHWEPLIEPFDIGFHVAKTLNPERLDVNIFSRKRIELTMTTNTIALASKSFEYLNSNPEEILNRVRGNDAPYRVLNMTGYPLTLWSDINNDDTDESSGAKKIEDGEEISWSFYDWRTQRENLSNNEQNSRLAIKIEDDEWATIHDIPVNKEGEKIYVLKQKQKTGSITHRVVVHISLRSDYVKYITLRSALLFENKTKIPLELVAVDEKGNKRSKIYKIAPDEDCAAPIRAAFDHGFKIRPDPGFHYQWSHQTLAWSELYQTPSLSVNCKPIDGEGSNWNFQCFSRFDSSGILAGRYPYQTIKISPPMEINNLLPYDLEYRIFDDKTKQDHKNFLRKGLAGPVHTVDLKHVLLLSAKLVDSHPKYQTSQFSVIHTNDPDRFRQEGKISVVDDQGLKTNLGLHYTKVPDSGGAFIVSIYAPYLILNKTGLDIQIKSKTFLQKARAGAGQLPSGDGKTAAPYIHSYASDERKNRSLLKIGNSNWSAAQSFEAIGSVSDISIPDGDHKEIHIGIQVEEGQGKYKLTKVVSLTPRFILKSSLTTDINIREPRSSNILSLKAGSILPLHFMRAGQERQLVMAFPGMDNNWSNAINIQDVGRRHVKLQKQGEHQQLMKVDILLEGPSLFLHISREVRWPFEIRNESKTDFIYYQGNPYPDEDQGVRYYPERYRIPAKCSMPYAWDFPAAAQHSLVLCPWTEKTSKTRHLRLDEIGSLEPFRVPGNPNKPAMEGGAVDLNIVAEGPQRKLIIRDYDPKTSLYKPKRSSSHRQRLLRSESSASVSTNDEFEAVVSTKDTRPTFRAILRLEGIGLSLINSRHQELAYISLRNIEATYADSPAEIQYDILCKWIQIDNQLYGGIYPILLYPTVVPKTGREMDIRPAWRAALTQAKDESHGVFFIKYATVLLQEMTMEVDEDFLFALLDFSKVPGASWSETHEGVLCDEKIKIPEPSGAMTVSDVYFEVLHLQPAQLNLSFVRTERVNVEDKTSSRNPLMFFFNVLTMALGNINDAPVRLNALLMENVLTSYPLLAASIQAHYGQEFFYQVHKILGSADFLGNPVGLFTNITSGVADIFYEPYNGFVMSDRPQELGIGIAKGTASFVKKTVFGVSDSISKVTGSVSKGLSVATMDKQFQDRRRMNRARNKPKHALYGVQQGGMALISSLGSGVEGLARQPFEGAEREGAAGFFKGVGKGLLGLATKPVIGVFDLASNVSEGIRNTTTVFDEAGLSKVRITRHVGRDGIVRPFNETEALGLFWLRQLNNSKLSKEDYLAHYNITDEATLLITYQTMILAKTKNFTVEWDIPFTDLKTIALEKTGIQLILKGVRGPFIPIEEESGRRFVYSKIKIAVTEYNNSG